MIIKPIMVRRALPEDVSFIKEMMWEANLASPTLIRSYGEKRLRQQEDRHWDEWLKNPTPVFVAEDVNKRGLGVLTLTPTQYFYKNYWKQAPGWQMGIGVEPWARRQGVGQTLVEYALAYCRETNAPYLFLTVDPANRTAQALYRKLGFAITTKRWGYLEMWVNFETAAVADPPELVASRRYFLHYWTNVQYLAARSEGLRYAVPYLVRGQGFARAGLKQGDFVYLVTVRQGELHVILKYEVDKRLSYEEVQTEFPKMEDLDPQLEYVTTRRVTKYSFEPPVEAEVSRALQILEGYKIRPLPVRADGTLGNNHHWQKAKIAEIIAESAALLDGFVEQFQPLPSPISSTTSP